MNSTKTMVRIGALCALAAASAMAQVPASRTPVTPGILNYQGRLQTPEGGFYTNGVYTIEFRLYGAATGASTGLWGCAYPVYVKEGYFNVMLGAPGGMALSNAPAYGPLDLWKALWYNASASAGANDRYLGLKVIQGPPGAGLPDPPVEAFPRQRFLSAPFAERAQMAQYARAAADTFTVGTTLTVTGTVTAIGGLTVRGATSLTNTTVNGTMTLNRGVTVNNVQGLFTKGLTSSGAVTHVKSGLDVSGTTAFRGGVNAVNSKIQEDGNNLVPRGVIVMWHGSTPPAGWALCNGQNGTPDLRGRFVLGSGAGAGLTTRTWGQAGGAENHALSVAELPPHNHNFAVGTVGYVAAWNGSAEATRAPNQGRNNGTQTQGTGATGSGHAHNNMPPFYVLAYIMKL